MALLLLKMHTSNIIVIDSELDSNHYFVPNIVYFIFTNTSGLHMPLPSAHFSFHPQRPDVHEEPLHNLPCLHVLSIVGMLILILWK